MSSHIFVSFTVLFNQCRQNRRYRLTVIGLAILLIYLSVFFNAENKFGWNLLSSSRYIIPLPDSERIASLRVDCKKFRPVNETDSTVVLTKTYPSFLISLHRETYDSLRWKIAKTGTYYEKFLTYNMFRFLHDAPASLLVDVGANIGWFSLYGAAMGHSVIA